MIRTIGIARATLKIGVANLVYDIKRLIFLEKTAMAQPEGDRGAGAGQNRPPCRSIRLPQ